MIDFKINYSIKKTLDKQYLLAIKKVIKIANDVLNLPSSLNYFDLMFVGIKKIKDLNTKYRNKNKVTDVISLAYNKPFLYQSKDINILGEIYIAYDIAIKQAKKYNHSLKREICFLVLHGLLHLIGYDHMNLQDEKKMFDLQELILEKANIKR
ncbi:MAG: rRNA maturation RNase YbeY [Mycoplasmataceae bacterium]|nr:rRNA maturation RNase YbeY [Mycoplasmataceae bacterium]MBQ5500626.1 rRNA maturation RNase YbeY [Mycoplasmataceae bacterium]